MNTRTRRPTDSRLLDIAEMCADHQGTELGPQDREDVREAMLELLKARADARAANKGASHV